MVFNFRLDYNELMKKLLLLLLLSLGFISSADAMTRCADGSYVSGRNCQRAPNGTYVSGSSGDTGSSYGNSYYSGSSGVGAAANYNAGALFAEGLFSLFGSSSNNQTNNTFNRRLFDYGIWQEVGLTIYGPNGFVCTGDSHNARCNNGVNYWLCGKKSCASDGTSYQSNIDNL